MRAKIFLIDDDGKNSREMVETPYEAEEVLQRLLISTPELLPGDQIDPDNPREWLLVAAEMGVPSAEGGGNYWSLDHLFLDQDGIPTFVECKQSSDTRIRREVVAQMLEYAANGSAYWPVHRLRQAAAETSRNGVSLDNAILKLIGKESLPEEDQAAEIENYWKQAENNLASGTVRLLFVADEIPKELRRLVEFLNEKMPDIEVLAVEVKQFVGEGRKAVVSRVVGLTEKVRNTKKGAETNRPSLTREEFLAHCTPEAAQFFADALNLAEARRHLIYRGTVGISIRARLANEDQYSSFVYCWPPNSFEVYLKQWPLSDHELSILREELLASGIFQAVGKFTLKTTLTGATLNRVAEVYSRILSRVDELVERAKGTGESTREKDSA